ncbi:MAG: hypothetical protein WDW36_007132 [Sanguina aurantia]
METGVSISKLLPPGEGQLAVLVLLAAFGIVPFCFARMSSSPPLLFIWGLLACVIYGVIIVYSHFTVDAQLVWTQVTGYLLLDICLGAAAAVIGACAWPTLACSEMQIRVACALEEMGLAIDRAAKSIVSPVPEQRQVSQFSKLNSKPHPGSQMHSQPQPVALPEQRNNTPNGTPSRRTSSHGSRQSLQSAPVRDHDASAAVDHSPGKLTAALHSPVALALMSAIKAPVAMFKSAAAAASAARDMQLGNAEGSTFDASQAEKSSQAEARRAAVHAVAHERLVRNRAMGLVTNEPGDDLYIELMREATMAHAPPSTADAPDQHQHHLHLHPREPTPQGPWVVKQKAPAAAQRQQQQQGPGGAGHLVRERGHADQGQGLVSIQLQQQQQQEEERARPTSPPPFPTIRSVGMGGAGGGREVELAIDVKALPPPPNLSKHSTASVRPLLARAHACKDEATYEPLWLLGRPVDLDAYGAVLVACEVMVSRISAMEVVLSEPQSSLLAEPQLLKLYFNSTALLDHFNVAMGLMQAFMSTAAEAVSAHEARDKERLGAAYAALLSYDWDATRSDLREQLEGALAVYWQVHAEQSLRSVREGGLTAGAEEEAAAAADGTHSSHMVNARQIRSLMFTWSTGEGVVEGAARLQQAVSAAVRRSQKPALQQATAFLPPFAKMLLGLMFWSYMWQLAASLPATLSSRAAMRTASAGRMVQAAFKYLITQSLTLMVLLVLGFYFLEIRGFIPIFAWIASSAVLSEKVISGIGFLGAGTILFLQKEQVIRGLTTAAGLWAVAAVGLAAGTGLFFAAIAASRLANGAIIPSLLYQAVLPWYLSAWAMESLAEVYVDSVAIVASCYESSFLQARARVRVELLRSRSVPLSSVLLGRAPSSHQPSQPTQPSAPLTSRSTSQVPALSSAYKRLARAPAGEPRRLSFLRQARALAPGEALSLMDSAQASHAQPAALRQQHTTSGPTRQARVQEPPEVRTLDQPAGDNSWVASPSGILVAFPHSGGGATTQPAARPVGVSQAARGCFLRQVVPCARAADPRKSSSGGGRGGSGGGGGEECRRSDVAMKAAAGIQGRMQSQVTSKLSSVKARYRSATRAVEVQTAQATQARLKVADASTRDATTYRVLVEARVHAGLDDPQLLDSADSQVARMRGNTAMLAGSSQLDLAQLAALAGVSLSEIGTLRALPLPAVGAGLPRDAGIGLIARRADIVAARWQIEASSRSIDSARAAYYPDVSLMAIGGFLRAYPDLGSGTRTDLTLGNIGPQSAEHGGPESSAASAYAALRAFIAQRSEQHVLRLWNYLGAINQGAGDAERYKQFCDGRASGMGAFFADGFPAASAIGHHDPSHRLQVYLLACDQPGTRVENPRQVSAWRYPRQYGRTPPSFARAMSFPAGDVLAISGTAAVVGHASAHDDDLDAQLDETLLNLGALLATADMPAGFDTHSPLKTYVRHAVDAPRVSIAKLCPTGASQLALTVVLAVLGFAPLASARMSGNAVLFQWGQFACILYGVVIVLGSVALDASLLWDQVVAYLVLSTSLAALVVLLAALVLPSLACSEMQEKVAGALLEMGLAVSGVASCITAPTEPRPPPVVPSRARHPSLQHPGTTPHTRHPSQCQPGGTAAAQSRPSFDSQAGGSHGGSLSARLVSALAAPVAVLSARLEGCELRKVVAHGHSASEVAHPHGRLSCMFGAGDGALRPANPLSGVERAGHIPRVTGVAAAAGGSAGLAPEATAGAGAGAGAVTQAEESSLLEARQSAVRAVAHERRLRNRAVDVVADELGDDLFVEMMRDATMAFAPPAVKTRARQRQAVGPTPAGHRTADGHPQSHPHSQSMYTFHLSPFGHRRPRHPSPMQPPTPATPISPQLQAPESDTQAVQGLGADRASSPQATADAWQQPVQRQSRQRGEWQQRGKGMVPAHGCVTRPRRSAPLHGVSGVRVMLTRAGLCRDEVRGDVERENGGVGFQQQASV